MILIVGGTGTLGRELIRQLPDKRIRVLSRCELKQKDLLAEFPHVECVLGDIRGSLDRAMEGVEYVFHVAALKHVDTLEANAEESVRTNILGTMNVCEAAKRAGVKRLVFSSTDKAVCPINVYGMSKGISERIVLNHGYTVYRWGNIVGSRGSALHYFINAIRKDETINVTHPDMSRFWMKIEDAVAFMLDTYQEEPGVRIPAMKAAPVLAIINALAFLMGKEATLRISGLRPGEKIHESLTHEVHSNTAAQYTFEELTTLLKPFV